MENLMALLAIAVFVFGWFWSIRAGIEVGLLCAALNFLFPPISQFIFCIYEQKMRIPTLVMIIGILLGTSFTFKSIPASQKPTPTSQAQHNKSFDRDAHLGFA